MLNFCVRFAHLYRTIFFRATRSFVRKSFDDYAADRQSLLLLRWLARSRNELLRHFLRELRVKGTRFSARCGLRRDLTRNAERTANLYAEIATGT